VRIAREPTPAPAPTRGPELAFAEVLRPGRGRCYRDYYSAERRLLDVVACVPPAEAKLSVGSPSMPVQAVRVGAM
jgi:hypothetical protein